MKLFTQKKTNTDKIYSFFVGEKKSFLKISRVREDCEYGSSGIFIKGSTWTSNLMILFQGYEYSLCIEFGAWN